MAKIDSVYDFTDKALVELKSWLEPWFLRKDTTQIVDTPSFAEAVAELAATRDLRGYWRLGEGASPFADTSGHVTPAAAVKHTSTTAMSENVSGALPAADDDGAVAFNAFALSDYLSTGGVDPTRFDFALTDTAVTVAAWIKPSAGTTAAPATVAGEWFNDGTYGGSGYRIGVNFPALTPFFERRRAAGGTPDGIATGLAMVADTWYFVVGTYNGTAGHNLYVNGILAASDATTFQLISAGFGFYIGYGVNTGGVPTSFKGAVDEVSVWGWALTAAEVATLYESGVGVDPGVGTFWFHGSGTPASSLGDDGAYYLDTATGHIWFKASGAWAQIWP